MKIYLILGVIIAVSSCIHAKLCHSPSDKILNCDKAFGIVHKCNSDFVSHAMITSNPFHMCTDASAFYSFRYTMDFYSKLFTMTEEDDKSHFCSDEFLSRNRMNVISTLIANSKKLWDDAYCDNCYEDSTSANYSFSFETKKFLNYSQAFDLCVDSTKEKFNESVICVECQNDYQKLNNLYEEFKKADQKKICFDLEDKMNKTRREWSGVYKCYKGKRDSLTAFYSLSSTIIIIAVSFYSAVYIIGSKYPGNETLDEQEVVRIAPTENATSSRDATAPGPSSSSHNRAPGPPSSSHNRAAKKYKKSDRELIINDDSDDDILTSPNQNSTLISLNN